MASKTCLCLVSTVDWFRLPLLAPSVINFVFDDSVCVWGGGVFYIWVGTDLEYMASERVCIYIMRRILKCAAFAYD